MPLNIKEVDRNGAKAYQVVEPDGRVLGTHESKRKAFAQIMAIQISKKRREGSKVK